jgi:hypothetical protein
LLQRNYLAIAHNLDNSLYTGYHTNSRYSDNSITVGNYIFKPAGREIVLVDMHSLACMQLEQ